MKIYTKTGDSGETGLIDGSRVHKDDPRVAAYGDVDELNAAVGVARAHAPSGASRDLLHAIQRDLFAIGAQLADPAARVGARKAKAAVSDTQVGWLEQAIDERAGKLPELKAFILPGGSPVGSFLHLCRTVCRRAERSAVALAKGGGVDPVVVVYLNRLSDLLFVLAREDNHRAGQHEEKW